MIVLQVRDRPEDISTATRVGKRHGELLIYRVNVKQMIEDGYEFYLSKNNVWLTKSIPRKYLS